MHCMKCGVEIPDGQVFCDHCLEIMEGYPVSPDAHVHLPRRTPTQEATKKASRKRKIYTQEELVANLKLRVLRLRLVVVILAFLLCLLGSFIGYHLYQHSTTRAIGTNYTIDTTMGK